MILHSPSRLTGVAFDRLLGRLDPDRDRAGEKYQHLRLKLIKFFEWRGSPWPDEKADECLDRLLRRLDENGEVHNLEAFVGGTARLMLLESRREQARERGLLAGAALTGDPPAEPGRWEAPDCCLDSCLRRLAPEQSTLIIEYYRCEGSERIRDRRELAARLGLPMGGLRLRVHRLRAQVEACLRQCLGAAR